MFSNSAASRALDPGVTTCPQIRRFVARKTATKERETEGEEEKEKEKKKKGITEPTKQPG
jgi:hypothetical protein